MSRRSKIFRVQIQSEVFDELDQIYRFVFQDSPRRAKFFTEGLKRKILSLQCLPHRGSRAKIFDKTNLLPEIRFLEFKGHLIFYVIEGNVVTVLHVTGPGQDWMKLFL